MIWGGCAPLCVVGHAQGWCSYGLLRQGPARMVCEGPLGSDLPARPLPGKASWATVAAAPGLQAGQ